MKKLLLRLLIALSIMIAMNACAPGTWGVTDEDVVVGYYNPGYYYYGGNYHSRPRGYISHRHDNHHQRRYR